VAAGELIAALQEGRANIHQQRRAARLLWEWMPRGMDGLPPLRASAALVARVETAIAKHASVAEAYRAIAAEDGTDPRTERTRAASNGSMTGRRRLNSNSPTKAAGSFSIGDDSNGPNKSHSRQAEFAPINDMPSSFCLEGILLWLR
jgi:hypothetical protein